MENTENVLNIVCRSRISALALTVSALALTVSHLGLPAFGGRVLVPLLEDAVDIDDLVLLVLPEEGEVVHEGVRDEHLDDDVPDHPSGSDDDALNVDLGVQRHQLEGEASVLHDEQLQHEDANDDDDEQVVDEDVGEDVELVLLQLAGIQEVEDLQEDENVEENRQMLPVLLAPDLELVVREVLHIEDLVSLEQDYRQHQAVVQTVEDDPSPHLRRDYVLVTRVGHSLQQLLGRRVRRQRQGCQGVHDQVDPQHLHWSEG